MRLDTIRNVLLVLVVTLSGPALLACDREEGPMEELGESIDDAVDEAKEELE